MYNVLKNKLINPHLEIGQYIYTLLKMSNVSDLVAI